MSFTVDKIESKHYRITDEHGGVIHVLKSLVQKMTRNKINCNSLSIMTTYGRKLRCPKCGGAKFQSGPRGGLAQNFRCECGAIVCVSPFGVELV